MSWFYITQVWTFDRKPVEYPEFMREFQAMFGNKSLTDEIRLVYLLRQCNDLAFKKIECCKFLPSSDYCHDAKHIFCQMFGKPFMAFECVFKTVKCISQQIKGDRQDFTEFLCSSLTYQNPVMSLNYGDELNSVKLLKLLQDIY